MADNKLALVLSFIALASVASYYFYHSQNRVSPSLSLSDFKDVYRYTDLELRVSLFKEWMIKYNKEYSSMETPLRFAIWNKNYDFVQEQNAKDEGVEVEMNKFSDLSTEEFSALYLGYIGRPEERGTENVEFLDETGLADAVDWRTKGAVSAIRDQGQCGGCYSFSAAGALEGLAFLSNKSFATVPVFAPQVAIDCSKKNSGCNGGLMDYVFEYVMKYGIANETDYPYIEKNGTCTYTKKKNAFKCKNYTDVPANNDDQLIAAIAKGPVSVAIEADKSIFQSYRSGVITGSACGTSLDHGVLAVGYGVENNTGKKYILVKNSWGTSWGDQGYVKIGRASGAGVCGINQAASYPVA